MPDPAGRGGFYEQGDRYQRRRQRVRSPQRPTLPDDGNIVYAGIRETGGRNAGRAAEQAPANARASQVSDEISRIVALPAGTRPFRSHIDPADDGSEEVSAVADRIRAEFLTRIGLEDLLYPAARE